MSQAPGGKGARLRRHERRHEERSKAALDAPTTLSQAACFAHSHGKEVWVTCTHTKLVTHARFVNAPDLTGEALCPECQKMVDAGTPHLAQLRLACGTCVRAHFRLEQKALS